LATQQGASIAIGQSAGKTSQEGRAIAIGLQAGETDQSANSIAIGRYAGRSLQEQNCVAIGSLAGQTSQGEYSVAIGSNAGNSQHGNNAIAIGQNAGKIGLPPHDNAIAIGENAGFSSQGANAIAIGQRAGETTQPANSIVINAQTATALNPTSTSSFWVKPISPDINNNVLYYDDGTGEITYGTGGGGGLALDCSNIVEVSNVYFCNGTALLGNHGDYPNPPYPGLQPPTTNRPIITVSGDFDMSCNNIFDVSRVYFCSRLHMAEGRTYIGTGTSFDISCGTGERFVLTVPQDLSAVFNVGTTTEMAIDASHVSILKGSPGTPAINFGLASDYRTGMYQASSSNIGFSCNAQLTATISRHNVSALTGSSSIPSYNFLKDIHTGMYNIANDTLGFSVGDCSMVKIYPAPSGNYIQGLNIDLSGTQPSGIRRLSASPAKTSWEDGHLGNPNYVYFTAQDFIPESTSVGRWQYGTNGILGPITGFGTSTTAVHNLMASKIIPKGFKIVEDTSGANIYCQNKNPWGSVFPITAAMTGYVASQQIKGMTTTFTLHSPPTALITSASWGGAGGGIGDATILTSPGSGVSDGTLLCIIYTQGTNSIGTVPWQNGSGIIGGRVKIERG